MGTGLAEPDKGGEEVSGRFKIFIVEAWADRAAAAGEADWARIRGIGDDAFLRICSVKLENMRCNIRRIPYIAITALG